MSLRKSLLAASVLAGGAIAAPTLASAQPVSGLYIGAGAGVNWVQSPSDITLPGGSFGLPANAQINNAGKIDFKTGWGAVGSLGWGFGNGFRAEVEGNFRNNEVDSIKGFSGLSPFGGSGGWQRTYGVMVNGFYDLDFANFGLGQSIFQPYVGVGVGYAWTNWRNVRTVSQGTGLSLNADGTDGNFAFQGIVGIGTPLTWLGARGLTLTAEYRFMGTLDPGIQASWRNPQGQTVAGGRFEPQNYNHSIMLGVRYALFQPPPPAPAAAPIPSEAPAPARTYLVFFDWDRADLTERARQIIAEAAQNSRRVQSTQIEVAGHADRSGSPQYNQRLSQRRADAVAAELVRNGVSRGEIAVTAYGETRPLVPTADGVREPQNRRVEIVLR
jgi:outer membrane protein OmpA-like peptidoglycan-associated protein